MPSAIDVSSVLGLTALGMFTAQILMGLLISTGYNPIRHWPRQRWIKLYKFHNWLGYIALATACLHPLTLLTSSESGFRLFDVFVPIWSPTQPIPSTLGAIALYLIAFVVLTLVLPSRPRPSQLEAAPLHGVRRRGGVLRARRVGGSAAEESAGGLD